MAIIELEFYEQRETKNTVRFQEEVDINEFPMIGTLYVQKDALRDIGWEPGEILYVQLSLASDKA